MTEDGGKPPHDGGTLPVDAGQPDAGQPDGGGCTPVAETCNGRDDDCNGVVDDGNVCSCTLGSPPAACGADGGTCTQACLPTGMRGQCLPPGATTVDLVGDVQNCGECGRSCPLPLHADARCQAGRCGRGPCEAGFFDLDGPATPGCEAACVNRVCTFPDGGTVNLTADPLPERSGVFHSFSSGASFGAQVQTNSQYSNVGVFGQGVPQGEQSAGGGYRHAGGFTSAVK